MNKKTIKICAIAWGLSVVAAWVALYQWMVIPPDKPISQSDHIGTALLASLSFNLLWNPLLWIIAVSYMRAAKNAPVPYKSKWRFYVRIAGVVVAITILAICLDHITSNSP